METFSGTIRFAVGLPGDSGLGLPAQGVIEVADGDTVTRVSIIWDATSTEAEYLHLQLCDRACVEAASVAVAGTQGSSPLELDVPSAERPDVHWRVYAAEGLSVAQPFAGQVVVEADAARASSAVTHQAQASVADPGDRVAPVLAVVGLGAFALALRRLVRLGPVAVLFRHCQDPLQHPVRRAIYDAVEHDPGIHFRALKRLLSTGHGNLDRHLRRMVRAGLLREANVGGLRTFVVAGHVSPTVHRALGVLRSHGARTILALLLEHPSQGVRPLARESGMAASTVARHLDRFHAAGLIERGPTRCRLGIRPTPLACQTAGLLS